MTKPFAGAKARTKKPILLRKGPDRRRQIIAAASELFARNGFEGTSIRDIAAASGVLSGSLYYHFPSKEDLLLTVHQESLTAMRQEVEAAIAGINEPWNRLDEAIVAHCRILLGGSVTRAILTPPRYYDLKCVRDSSASATSTRRSSRTLSTIYLCALIATGMRSGCRSLAP